MLRLDHYNQNTEEVIFLCNFEDTAPSFYDILALCLWSFAVESSSILGGNQWRRSKEEQEFITNAPILVI